MDDLISRHGTSAWLENMGHPNLAKMIMDEKRFPSAQPEQKRGKWINGYCSECGEHAPYWAMASAYHTTDFCPSCGADMREFCRKENR